ncbi:MAG: PEGA domain-containing protein [Deltaproteobacteria bacterium]|nr:PEGA domain-containing protein [Deltaproteobacteria bacterium]
MKATIFVLLFPILIPAHASAQDLPIALDEKGPKKAQGVKVVSTKIEAPLQSKTYAEKTESSQAEKARAIFKRANKYFEDRNLPVALSLYKKAYNLWPHPRIIFNMGVTLGMMSKPLEAALMFKAVLELGPEPVEAHRYKEAKERYLELMGTLAILRISSQQSGTKVYVDGNLVATAPFTKEILLTGGRHLVTANLTGHIAFNRDIFLPSGIIAEKIVTLNKFEPIVKFKKVKRYGNIWPIVAAGASAVLLGSGGFLVYQGRSEIDDLQAEVNLIAGQSIEQGTILAFDYDLSKQDGPLLKQNVGSAMIGVGITGAITAAVLYFFQEKQVQYTVTPDSNVEKTHTLE